jgi:serine/threonine protein kinase
MCYFVFLVTGIQIFHEANLVHRDIKPDNILKHKNKNAIILKLSDFGFSRSIADDNLAKTICGFIA